MFTGKLSFKALLKPAVLIGLAMIALLGLPSPNTNAQDNPFAAGQLAFAGLDGNIYLLNAPDAEPVALTTDARGMRRQYSWPTWSTDGRLAFFAEERPQRSSDARTLKIFIKEPDAESPVLAYESQTEFLTYAYWAPADCPTRANCRDLAVLVTGDEGLGVIRVRDEAPEYTINRIGLGAPFYYSYSPDASRMVWQRFGRQIELYDTAANEIIELLPDSAGLFQAPMWSPVDDRLLFSVIGADGVHNLVIAEGDERQVIATDQAGALWFSWSPDGAYIAWKRDLGPLNIIDSRTGDTVALTSRAPVAAFFWAPDSQKIAYLTLPDGGNDTQVTHAPAPGKLAAPAAQSGLPFLTWNILDMTTGARWAAYDRFVPSPDMFYFIAYFDQFAQSHQLWSPDSRYLVYSSWSETGRPLITLLDTATQTAGSMPITEGDMGVWSYGPPDSAE